MERIYQPEDRKLQVKQSETLPAQDRTMGPMEAAWNMDMDSSWNGILRRLWFGSDEVRHDGSRREGLSPAQKAAAQTCPQEPPLTKDGQ
jgi:hypothetical protein